MEDDGPRLDGTPFNVLMQQAVKLKTHMHKIDRVKFDQWPKFYQNSAFVRDEQREERKLPFLDRMKVAKEYKKKGDGHFEETKDYLQASLNYEWALGLFKWATPKDKNWRNKSVEDNDMDEEVFQGETEDEKDEILEFRIRCLLNLSRAYFKQNEFLTARQACDWALGLDQHCERALLLRARCLVAPKSHGATERDSAIADLEEAERLTDSVKRLKEIQNFLTDLRHQKKLGKEADKKYAGLFDRGELYDKDEASKRTRPYMDAVDEPVTEDDAFRQTPVDAQFAAAERLHAQYVEEGKMKEADELRHGLEEARKKLATKKPSLNFREPTEEMKKDAKERGIDLDDPQVLDMLEELQRQKEDPGRAKRRGDLIKAEKLMDFSVNELLRKLEVTGLDQSQCRNKNDLVDLLADALLDEQDLKDKPPPPKPEKKKKRRTSTWKLTLVLTFVLVTLRLYFSNLLRPLMLALYNGVPLDEAITDHLEKNMKLPPKEDVIPGVFDQEDEEWLDAEF